MTPELAPSQTPAGKGKPFPRYCHRCRKRSVQPATLPYRTEVRHDGQLYVVDTPHLRVPRCQECGELYFDNDAEEQVSRALRIQLRLLLPEQIAANRQVLGLSAEELASRLGVSPADFREWEEGLLIQSRAVDNLMRAFFAFPDVRSALRGTDQHPGFGAAVEPAPPPVVS